MTNQELINILAPGYVVLTDKESWYVMLPGTHILASWFTSLEAAVKFTVNDYRIIPATTLPTTDVNQDDYIINNTDNRCWRKVIYYITNQAHENKLFNEKYTNRVTRKIVIRKALDGTVLINNLE